jgi:hypothetical protein
MVQQHILGKARRLFVLKWQQIGIFFTAQESYVIASYGYLPAFREFVSKCLFLTKQSENFVSVSR